MKKLQIYLTIVIIVLLQGIIVSWADAAEPAPNEVILYEFQHYIGKSDSFKLPENLPYWQTPVGNKLFGKVSSIRLGSDVGVFLFERADLNRDVNEHELCWYSTSVGINCFPEGSENIITKSKPWLGCDDFYNALIIYRKKEFRGLVGVEYSYYRKKGHVGFRQYLFLCPPHTPSKCFELQDGKFDNWLLELIGTNDPENKVTARVYKQHSCTGEAVALPGPYSDKKEFRLENYGFSREEGPKSIYMTYEGPYNHYESKDYTKDLKPKEPQWIEKDTDRPGKDFRNFWVLPPGSEICSNACAEDPNCKAYTYVPQGLSGDLSKARCWLKYDVPDPVTREGMVSGVKLSFEHATKVADGSATKAGSQLYPKVEPGKAGIAMVDDIMGFHHVETKGNHLIFEVDYSAVASHGNIIHLGGWIYDGKGQAISGYKPLSFLAPGIRKGKVEITIDAGQGQFGKEIEFFLFEPNKAPFIKKRFPLNMRLPGATAQSSKLEMSTGYVVAPGAKAQGGQQIDLSGVWNSNIGLVYNINQNGNKISYQDPLMHKPVNGTVDGKTVTVSWMEGNAVKSIKGSITSISNDGVAKRIEWQNNVIYHR